MKLSHKREKLLRKLQRSRHSFIRKYQRRRIQTSMTFSMKFYNNLSRVVIRRRKPLQLPPKIILVNLGQWRLQRTDKKSLWGIRQRSPRNREAAADWNIFVSIDIS
jgi:hypothetical protein